MGRVSLKSFRPSLRFSSMASLAGVAVLLMLFQNCGKAGMDGETSDLASLTDDTPDVKKFKAAPFPYDVNINQIAFMTCPVVAKNSSSFGEDADNPFFTLRVGAFDNRSLATRYPAFFQTSTLTDVEKNVRLNAGVGLSNPFMKYMKEAFALRLANVKTAAEKQKLFRDAITNSTYKYKVASAFLLKSRNASGGFAWSADHAKGISPLLTGTNMANQLSLLEDLGGSYGTEKMHEATGVDISERGFVSSFSIPEDEGQRNSLRMNLSNYEFVVGYSLPDLIDVFNMASPTGDNNYTLYGKSYRLTMTNTWQGRVDRLPSGGTIIEKTGISSMNAEFLAGVEEWDTTVKGAAFPVSQREGHAWSCFSLMIVRDVDRRDPASKKILDPGEYGTHVPIISSSRDNIDPTCSLWDYPLCSTKMKFIDHEVTKGGTIIPAAQATCPIQAIGSKTQYGSLNYDPAGTGGINGLRLELARRFLPAEYWDINTHPEYMCAVPKETASSYGNCYKAGDMNSSSFIMYTQSATEVISTTTTTDANGTTVTKKTANVTCGTVASRECPAFVSICYRAK